MNQRKLFRMSNAMTDTFRIMEGSTTVEDKPGLACCRPVSIS